MAYACGAALAAMRTARRRSRAPFLCGVISPGRATAPHYRPGRLLLRRSPHRNWLCSPPLVGVPWSSSGTSTRSAAAPRSARSSRRLHTWWRLSAGTASCCSGTSIPPARMPLPLGVVAAEGRGWPNWRRACASGAAVPEAIREQDYGARRATRKPLRWLRRSGAHQLRYAERRSSGRLAHEPPRTTRPLQVFPPRAVPS